MIALLLSVLFAWSAPSASAHDFHVSRLTINVDSEQRQLEITLESFVDDLELSLAAVARRGGSPEVSAANLNLVTDMEHPQSNALLEEYLRDVLEVRAGGEALQLEYLGKEAAHDPYALFMYMRVPLTAKQLNQPLSVISSFMLELYKDQQNIVVWQYNGEAASNDLLTTDRRTSTLRR